MMTDRDCAEEDGVWHYIDRDIRDGLYNGCVLDDIYGMSRPADEEAE